MPTFSPEVVATNTSTPIPTQTPLPPLSPEEALATVTMLYETNRDCDLPCWWGFRPGQTDWLTAKEFLTPFVAMIYEGLEPPKKPRWTVEVHVPNSNGMGVPMIHHYLVEEGVIQAFEIIMLEPTSLFAPVSILDKYGMPEEIYLKSGQFDTGYLMTFYYPDYSFRIGYTVREGTNENGLISACFKEGDYMGITAWPIYDKLSFIETFTLFGREDSGEYQLPLDIATGMDISTFYETFSDPDVPICLETPTDIWPGW
jgi:hypothetical protein